MGRIDHGRVSNACPVVGAGRYRNDPHAVSFNRCQRCTRDRIAIHGRRTSTVERSIFSLRRLRRCVQRARPLTADTIVTTLPAAMATTLPHDIV